MRGPAEMIREAYATCTWDAAYLKHPIVNLTGLEFYGEGYEDCDRRMPNLTKAKELLGWEPTLSLKDTLLETVTYYYDQYRNWPQTPSGAALSQISVQGKARAE
jgi:UDP-apiose/xylose synthase